MALSLSYGCQFEDEISPKEISAPKAAGTTEDFGASTGGAIELGKKLQNPYALRNMQKAWNIEKNTPVTLAATHLYIRFEPKDIEQVDILEELKDLELYDHPLDYEITKNGDYYHDISIPAEMPTYQYAAVPIGVLLPKEVAYTILEELYLPDEDDSANDLLVSQALRLTDNLTVEENKQIADRKIAYGVSLSGIFSQPSKWRPKGRIQMYDSEALITTTTSTFSHYEMRPCDANDGGPGAGTYGTGPDKPPLGGMCEFPVYVYTTTTAPSGGFIGVHGTEVRARRWFTTHRGFTDKRGYYTCDGRFRRKANYTIMWKRYHVRIRSGNFGRAKLNGPKKKGDWNVSLGNDNTPGDIQQYYAIIFQAAYNYYYENIDGLKRPPLNSDWKPRMKIAAIYNSGGGLGQHQSWVRSLGFGVFPPIKIWYPHRNLKDIYATTIHELAHASHWELRKNYWILTSNRVIESWARGVQWYLGNKRYNNYNGGANIPPHYTQVVVDMIDDVAPVNSSTGLPIDINNGSEVLVEDSVSRYSILQIENTLEHTRTWNSWKNKIENSYENGTEENLEALFDHWYFN